MVDDDCPYCGARHISPHDAHELTFLIMEKESDYVVMHSPETAEHAPDYIEVAAFPTREAAEAYVIGVDG
jgi:hypothetical protein